MNYVISRNAFILGQIELCVKYSKRLLQQNFESPNKQATYLREFLFTFKKWQESVKEKISEVPIPAVINDAQVTVYLKDYPPKSPLQEIWNEMENSLSSVLYRPVLFGRSDAPKFKFAVIGGLYF